MALKEVKKDGSSSPPETTGSTVFKAIFKKIPNDPEWNKIKEKEDFEKEDSNEPQGQKP